MSPYEPLSIYLHIPFCSVMCTYCAFITYTDMDDLIPAYVDALTREIEIIAASKPNHPVKTIFFGGGTPSLLTPQQYEQLFTALNDGFDILTNAEISLESNPNDLTQEYLQSLKSVGFNRLSIGMQSTNPDVLTLYNRQHTTQTVNEAFQAARDADFDNISLDLIFNAPNETLKSWEATLNKATALNPENISHYELILKGGTDLTQRIEAGELPTPDDDLGADMYDLATDILTDAGYQQYEISNWSKPNYESQHNLQYWRLLPYVGLGCGAHGYANHTYTIVMRHPQKYIETLQQAAITVAYEFPATPAQSKTVKVDLAEEMKDAIIMGLRMTKEGIQREAFKTRFGVDIVEANQDAIDKHINYGLLEVDDTRLRLTQAGRLLTNSIIRDLI